MTYLLSFFVGGNDAAARKMTNKEVCLLIVSLQMNASGCSSFNSSVIDPDDVKDEIKIADEIAFGSNLDNIVDDSFIWIIRKFNSVQVKVDDNSRFVGERACSLFKKIHDFWYFLLLWAQSKPKQVFMLMSSLEIIYKRYEDYIVEIEGILKPKDPKALSPEELKFKEGFNMSDVSYFVKKAQKLFKDLMVDVNNLFRAYLYNPLNSILGMHQTLKEQYEYITSGDFFEKKKLVLDKKLIENLHNPWQTQYEYRVIEQEKRGNFSLNISREYTVTDATLEIKCLGLNAVPNPPLPSTRHMYVKLYEGMFDVSKDFYLPLSNALIRKVFVYFTMYDLEKRPTWRRSAKLNLDLRAFAFVVNQGYSQLIYPETFYQGRTTSSDHNKHYLDDLAYAFGLRRQNGQLLGGDVAALEAITLYNGMNFSVAEGTSSLVTKKLYNVDTEGMFDFDDNENRIIDPTFGYNTEIVPQFMLGFDFERIETTLGLTTAINAVSFTFDYSILKDWENKLKINIISDYYV